MRQTDRQTDRQTQTYRHTDAHTLRYTYSQTDDSKMMFPNVLWESISLFPNNNLSIYSSSVVNVP